MGTRAYWDPEKPSQSERRGLALEVSTEPAWDTVTAQQCQELLQNRAGQGPGGLLWLRG